MPLKVRLIHGDVFDATRRFYPVNIFDTIDQKEGVTMGKNSLDQLDVGTCEFGHLYFPQFWQNYQTLSRRATFARTTDLRTLLAQAQPKV
jgi:hypothetical protein